MLHELKNNKLIEMRELIFHHPDKVVFGNGVISRFSSDCVEKGFQKVFILGIAALEEKMDELTKMLSVQNIQSVLDYSIEGEPVFQDLDGLLEKVRRFEPDAIVGIGGGSVLDTAKILAVLHKGSQGWEELIGIGLVKSRNTWMACMPTTSGTGSEVSPNAIFLDKRDGGKKGVISPFLVPDAAYIDPELTIGVPAAITSSTGVDALTHCMEAYMNKYAHPMTDMYALKGIQLITKSLPTAYVNGNDVEARNNVALGSLYGGMCLGPVNTAAVHALAYPLGSMFGIPHGLANALMLPYVMEFNMEAAVERFANVACAMGVVRQSTDLLTAHEGLKILRDFLRQCGISGGLSSISIPTDSVNQMADEALKVQRLLKNNLREVSHEDAVYIYERAFDGF